jgi:hypothetical protein
MRRNLRIAASGLCVVTSVLLIAMWIRSYWEWDMIEAEGPQSQFFAIGSASGVVGVVGSPYFFSLSEVDIWSPAGDRITPEHFSFSRDKWGINLNFPYWLPTYLVAAAATVSWIKFPTRTDPVLQIA